MTIRQMQEQRELEYLSKYAAFSSKSKGREIEEEQCISKRQRQNFAL